MKKMTTALVTGLATLAFSASAFAAINADEAKAIAAKEVPASSTHIMTKLEMHKLTPYFEVKFYDNENGFVEKAEYRNGKLIIKSKSIPCWLDELQQLLHHEEEVAAESEVIAAAAASQGFEIIRLKPSYAREHHFPLYIPAPAVKKPTANDYAVAAARVLKSGLNSTLLLHFKDQMSVEGQEPPVCL